MLLRKCVSSKLRQPFMQIVPPQLANSRNIHGVLSGCHSRIPFLRQFSAGSSQAEQAIIKKLKEAFQPQYVSVNDISGGCGSMYRIEIVSERFQGLSKVQQQRLVNQVLREDIKQWHGLQLLTQVPKKSTPQ